MHGFHQVAKLTFKKRPVPKLRAIAVEQKRIIAQPSMRQLTVEIHPHIKPTNPRHGPMPVPLAGAVKTRLARSDGLPAVLRLDFASASRDEPQTKLSQHTALFPFELIIGRMPRTRIWLMWTNRFPTGVSYVKRLLEKAIVQRKGMRMVGRVSHLYA